jgi:hypothetical protein
VENKKCFDTVDARYKHEKKDDVFNSISKAPGCFGHSERQNFKQS